MDESSLLDLLECSVCLERLDTSAKVLPCQHTFCRRCLQSIVSSRSELRCPECRILVDCSVDELPANILLVRLLDGIKQRPHNSSASPPGTVIRDAPAANRSSPVKITPDLQVEMRQGTILHEGPALPERQHSRTMDWKVPPIPANLQDLQHQIEEALNSVTLDQLTRVVQEMIYRFDVCHATHGTHVECMPHIGSIPPELVWC
ncbi:SH3R3 ligase, partial [Polypterus senegalus]